MVSEDLKKEICFVLENVIFGRIFGNFCKIYFVRREKFYVGVDFEKIREKIVEVKFYVVEYIDEMIVEFIINCEVRGGYVYYVKSIEDVMEWIC